MEQLNHVHQSTLVDDPNGSKFSPSSTYHFATQCTTVDSPNGHRDQWGASSVPIYQTATFKDTTGCYRYSRSGNPTRVFLENHIAKLYHAKHAFALSSGMSALDTIFRFLRPGDETIAGDDLYGGSSRLMAFMEHHFGIKVHHVSTTNPTNLLPFLTKTDSKVQLVHLESPTNPLLQIADIRSISDLVHKHQPTAVVVVDNTMMSPYLQTPLDHGADIVYDSASKYLSGHHDVMAGVIACNRDDIAEKLAFLINYAGNGITPFDSFLVLRGIKTLAVRMDRQQSNAIRIANYLNDLGFHVNFPSLLNHPGRDIHMKLSRGPGAVLSFTTNNSKLSERIVAATRLWGVSVSFGGVNSLISMPCRMSHASVPAHLRNLSEDLIRLCVGIEDPDDLINDLESALHTAGAIKPSSRKQGCRIMKTAHQVSPYTISSKLEQISAGDLLDNDKTVSSSIDVSPSTSSTMSSPSSPSSFGNGSITDSQPDGSASII